MDSGLLSGIQGTFKRGRRTEDNLFMLEKFIEMVKGRKDEIQDEIDRVNWKKLLK